MTTAIRCEWVSGADQLFIDYHDREWGVPSHDDRHLFELLILEGAQAGLSWSTILRKREGYRAAFADFDIEAIAHFTSEDVERLMGDARIVRNRAKIEAAIQNARSALKVSNEWGSLDPYLWQFVGGAPIQNTWRTLADFPAETAASRAMSKDLKRHGFKFVGPTTCYAFMQAAGLVNDHQVSCFRYREVAPPVPSGA